MGLIDVTRATQQRIDFVAKWLWYIVAMVLVWVGIGMGILYYGLTNGLMVELSREELLDAAATNALFSIAVIAVAVPHIIAYWRTQ